MGGWEEEELGLEVSEKKQGTRRGCLPGAGDTQHRVLCLLVHLMHHQEPLQVQAQALVEQLGILAGGPAQEHVCSEVRFLSELRSRSALKEHSLK